MLRWLNGFVLWVALLGLSACSKEASQSAAAPAPMSQEQLTEAQVLEVTAQVSHARRDFDGEGFAKHLADEAQVRYLDTDGTPTELSKPQFSEYLTSLRGHAKSSKYEESQARVSAEGSKASYEVTVDEVLTFEGVTTQQRSRQTWQLEMREGRPQVVDMFIVIEETKPL